MGCTASKLDNEDTVRRCKERRNQMKEAIFARHHLAAAHSDYCRSLRVTGSALSAFAAGEPLSVSDHTPPVFLRTPNAAAATTVKIPTPPRMPSSSPSLHPQHPPPPFPPSPSPTVASTKHPHILSASSLPPSRHQQRRKPMKLPHILSDSSISSSPQSHRNPNLPNYTYEARPTYSSTPSQASSVWNWENFLPPSPPDSEFFRYRKDNCDDEKASAYSASTHKHYEVNNRQAQAHRNHLDTDEEETEREEVQCSDWGDHDSTTSSSDDEGLDAESRSEGGTRSDFGSSVNNEPKSAPAPAATDSKFSTFRKSDNPHDAGSSVSWNAGSGVISDKKIMVRHKDLAEMVTAIKEYFDKAASAGEQVLEMLETGPAQLNRSFRQLKKTVYHSSGVFSKLRSTWTSKPPLAVKYRFEPGSIEKEPGDTKSLCSTLERLLAWEKKLYQEVKAREGAKIEHEKKLSRLQSQEYKGINEGKLDKTKTAIKRLQSLIVVTSQAASTTSNAIIGIRDTELVPELVELCHGFMYMWRSMNEYHEAQNDIVQQVRGLINQSTKGESTTDIHRQSTRDLEAAVAAWQSSFCRLINFQRDFIRSLHAWFKLTLLPVDNSSGPTTPGKIEISEAFSFLDEWKLALDRLPDTVASEAVKSFVNVIHSISLKQIDEMKIKKRTESASRDLETKSSALRKIEKKYYQSYSTVGIGVPDTEPDDGHVLDTRDPLAEKKMEIAAYRRRLEEEVVRHSKAVEVTRAMTVNNIQTGLPGVFQALTSFSGLLMEALEVVCSRSYAIK